MSNIAWAPDERLQAYGAMAEAGFTGLEIAPGLFFHGCEDPFSPGEGLAALALTEMADHGLELVSMQSLLFGVEGAGLFDSETGRAALINGMIRAIDLAGRFGIPNLVFGSPAQRKVPSELPMNKAFGEAVEVFRTLGDRAQSAGTCITIEANPAAYGTNFLTTLEEAVAFVEQVDHPAIAPILDLGAMHMNGSFSEVCQHLGTLTSKLNHVHVSEPELAPAPADPERLAPVLRTLVNHGYKKTVSIEMRRPESGLHGVRASITALAQENQIQGLGSRTGPPDQ
ncbi:MAG: sugar phosphate isomerase/epimerase family protein [Pseudomonadota bacterium]